MMLISVTTCSSFFFYMTDDRRMMCEVLWNNDILYDVYQMSINSVCQNDIISLKITPRPTFLSDQSQNFW